MADISKVKINYDTYDIKDANARSRLDVIEQQGTVSAWGDINGTLSNQTDLQAALDAKLSYAGATASTHPEYTISLVDLVDGASELSAGSLYFYYEV